MIILETTTNGYVDFSLDEYFQSNLENINVSQSNQCAPVDWKASVFFEYHGGPVTGVASHPYFPLFFTISHDDKSMRAWSTLFNGQ